MAAARGLHTRATDPPSLTDGFVATMSMRIGGPIGRHAAVGGRWWNPVRVALLTGTLVYLAGVVFRLPCRRGADHFKNLCYSDIPLLYPGRGLLQGNTPYLDSGDYPVLEYPVLTGWFLELERRIALLLGAPSGPGLSDQQAVDATPRFVDVNDLLPVALTALAVLAWSRRHPALAGALLGLGMAAKLYPLLLLGPLLLLCLRAGRTRDFGRALVGFVL